MLTRKNDVDALVPDQGSSPSMFEFLIFRQEFPYLPALGQYYLTDDTRKNENNDFVTAVELKQLLAPYAHLINEPNICRWRIFYLFFVCISPEKTQEVNESCLAKVIVLLQLLANPDLVMNENKVERSTWFLLQASFENGQFGFDVLNFLFSYGLSYERFLEELQFAIESKNETHLLDISAIQSSLEEFLSDETLSEKKNILSKAYGIYRPILDLRRENNYIELYQTLRKAYKAYRDNNYLFASSFYENASTLLDSLSSRETESSLLIKKDYIYRSKKCIEYAQICRHLEKNEKTSLNGFVFTCFSQKTNNNSHQQDEEPLLQQKLKTS